MRLEGIVYTLAAGDGSVCLTVITNLAGDGPGSYGLRVQVCRRSKPRA